jgi:hypothetical protein
MASEEQRSEDEYHRRLAALFGPAPPMSASAIASNIIRVARHKLASLTTSSRDVEIDVPAHMFHYDATVDDVARELTRLATDIVFYFVDYLGFPTATHIRFRAHHRA